MGATTADDLPSIVYHFPEGRFGDNPSRQTNIARAFARYTDVVYLEAAPKLGVRSRPPRPSVRLRQPNLTVVADAFGLTNHAFGRRAPALAHALDGLAVRSLLRRLGAADHVLVVSAPVLWMGPSLRSAAVAYDCIDPFFDPQYQSAYDAHEKLMVEASDVVFVTAEALGERISSFGGTPVLLNNANDPDEFRADAGPGRPGCLTGHEGRVVVGYLGTIDSRVDIAVVAYAARCLPEYCFLVAGRVNADCEDAANGLRALPNVVMPGAVDDAGEYIAAFDVALIPYVSGPVGDAINPVKLYTYLGMGKPVVSTWIREAYMRPDVVTACRTQDEFVAAIQTAAGSRDDTEARARRLAFAARNTWDARAKAALDVLAALPREQRTHV